MTSLSPVLQIPLAGLVCAVLLVFLGWGATTLSWRTAPHRHLLIAPIVGLGYLTLWAWWSYRLGFSLSAANGILMLIPPTLVNCWAFLTLRISRRNLIPTTRLCVILAATGLLLFAVSMIPVFRDPTSLILTLGNNDLAHHTAISRFLQESNWKAPFGYVEQFPHAFLWFAENTYFGYYAVMAVVASLMGCYPHEVATGLLFLVPALALIPLHLLLREILKVPRPWAVFWSALAAVNGLTLYLLYHSFGAQMLGTMCALYLIYLTWRIQIRPSEWPAWSGLLPPTLAIISLLMIYQHMLPFVAIVLACPAAAAFIEGDRRIISNPTVKRLGLAFLVTLVLVPGRWHALVTWLVDAAGSASGWHVAFMLPDYLLGMTGNVFSQAHVGATAAVLRLPAIALIAACLGTGAIVGLQRRRMRPITLLLAASLIYIGALALARRDAAGVFGGYHSFKLLTFFSPLFTVLVGWAWTEARSCNARLKVAGLPVLLYFICYSALSIHTIQGGLTRGNRLPGEATNLVALGKKLGGAPVNIVSGDFWRSMWLHYFLLDRVLFSSTRTYYPETDISARTSISDMPPRFFEIRLPAGAPAPWNFTLTQDSDFLTATRGAGWHGPEENHVWMGAGGHQADVKIWVGSAISELHIDLELHPLLQDNRYSVLWNGRPVPGATSSTSCSFTVRVQDPGENLLQIESLLPPQPPGNGDHRALSFALRACRITAVK